MTQASLRKGNVNRYGQPLYNVGLTEGELQELILLIDDEPVDEEFLRGIRRKLKGKQRQLQMRVRNGSG